MGCRRRDLGCSWWLHPALPGAIKALMGTECQDQLLYQAVHSTSKLRKLLYTVGSQ